jgi:hypothetical protein
MGWFLIEEILLIFQCIHYQLSPPPSAEVKECVELYLYFPNTPSWHGTQLKNHRENFIFTVYSLLTT